MLAITYYSYNQIKDNEMVGHAVLKGEEKRKQSFGGET
jgi:hypothetical protein